MEGAALHAKPPMTFCPGLFVFLPDNGEIDYNKVNFIIENERKKSIQILKNLLQ